MIERLRGLAASAFLALQLPLAAVGLASHAPFRPWSPVSESVVVSLSVSVTGVALRPSEIRARYDLAPFAFDDRDASYWELNDVRHVQLRIARIECGLPVERRAAVVASIAIDGRAPFTWSPRCR